MKYLFLSILQRGFCFCPLKAEGATKKVESLKIEAKGLKAQQERLAV